MTGSLELQLLIASLAYIAFVVGVAVVLVWLVVMFVRAGRVP